MEEQNNHRPLTILMTTDTVGGVWTWSIELCRSLQSSGVQFHLVTMGAALQPYQRQEASALQNVMLHETDFLLEWMTNPWEDIDASGQWLLQLASTIQPQLVHLNAFSYAALSWNVPLIVTAHSDVYSWWLAVKGGYPPIEWNTYFKRVCNGLQKANFITAPSNAAMAEVRNIYGAVAPGKVIYNGRTATLFNPAAKEKTVFSMGRLWDEAKNISLLVEAAKQVSYPVRIAGESSFENDSCSVSGKNITALGKLPGTGVAEELSKAALYVLPAKYEPFGLSVLEAALSGCALLLGDIPSLREVWGDAALYVDTYDAEALASAINKLMTDEKLLQHYAAFATEKAKQYSTLHMAASYLDVYQHVLQDVLIT